MRLINADARIEEIKKAYCTGCENYNGIRCRACWVDDAIGLIGDAATVDAVEVVRCKDCKHYQKEFDFASKECGIFCGAFEHGYPTKPDDFCSYGERENG